MDFVFVPAPVGSAWDRSEGTREPEIDLLERKRCGPVQRDFSGQLLDAGPDLEQPFRPGVELSVCPLGASQGLCGKGMEQHRGGTMQEQAEPIGFEAMTGGLIGAQPRFMVLDEAFHAAPGTRDLFIDERGAATFKIGHHTARIRAFKGR